ncbi:MAG: hypothetical protein HY913_18755 [Desulfomonile tiedjei]|nr:hypothetical protein [Desulfomonile tiedjei]
MTKREHLNSTKEVDAERSSDDIRKDIVKGEESISQAVEQISIRIKEKLDWREYVKDSPYLALGAAAGLGYLASAIFKKRSTPMERFMGSMDAQVRHSLGGLLAGAAGPGLIKVTLIGIATKAAMGWIKNAAATTVASDGTGPKPRTAGGATSGSRVE